MDVLTTMLDDSIPLTIIEWEEVGGWVEKGGGGTHGPHHRATKMCTAYMCTALANMCHACQLTVLVYTPPPGVPGSGATPQRRTTMSTC